MKTCINSKLLHLALEKMVIGIEEPMLIKGIGELLAKIDSGNSGYNVIHGEDFTVQGDILTFKTVTKDGQERRVSKKIKETLRVNIGGGHIQERPVVELDVKFGGEDYKKVLFSVTDRSGNEHKVLISKDFVGKELDALIDVTKDNIADDNVNVDYVTENAVWDKTKAVGSGIKKALNTAGNAAATIATGTEGQQKWADKMATIRKAMQGERVAPLKQEKESEIKIDKNLEDEVNALGKMNSLLETDETLILSQLKTQEDKFPSDFGAKLSSEATTTDAAGKQTASIVSNVEIKKLLDYTGNTNIGSKNSHPEYFARMKAVMNAYTKYAQEEAKGENEEIVVSEAVAQPAQSSQTGKSTQPATNAVPANQQKKQDDPTKEIQGGQNEKDTNLLSKEEVIAELKNLQKRNRTIFYLITFPKDNNGNQLLSGTKLTSSIKNFQRDVNSWATKLIQTERWNKQAFTPFVTQLVRDMPKNAKGLFAICSGPQESRKVEFFTNPGLFYNNEESAETTKITDEIVQEYQQLNSLYKGLGGVGDISVEGIQTLLQQPAEVQPANSMETLVQEYKQLNDEFLRIADDLAGEGTSINLDDLQALITLGSESSQNKRSNELGQTDAGDSQDSSIQSYDMMS